jgi:hypothetical protein
LIALTGNRLVKRGFARGVNSRTVSQPAHHPRFIDGRKPGHSISEGLGHRSRIVFKGFQNFAARPASAILQRLWQIPVINRRDRFDSGRQQRIDQAVIEVEAALFAHVVAFRKQASPRDRESIGLDPEVLHDLNVIEIAVIVVICD